MENKNSKKGKIILTLLIVVIILAIISGLLFIKNKKNKVVNDGDILATSNQGSVTVGEVKEYLKNLNVSFKQDIKYESLQDEEKEMVIKEIINERVILKEAKKENLAESAEYKEKLANIEKLSLKEVYVNKIIADNITEAAIKAKYDEFSKTLEGKKQYKVKHIVVKTEEEIKKVEEELKVKPFADVAKKYSIDGSKDNGGDLGYVIDGQTVPEFEAVMKATPVNKLSKAFQTQFGWHVLLKKEEKPIDVPSFEASKETIKNNMITELLKTVSENNIKASDIKIIKK